MVTQKMGEIPIFETTEPVIWCCEDLLEWEPYEKVILLHVNTSAILYITKYTILTDNFQIIFEIIFIIKKTTPQLKAST